MRLSSFTIRLSSAVVLLIGSLGTMPARAATVDVGGNSGASSANAVTHWNAIATSTLIEFPPPAGGAPPALQVNLAMVQGAVYDAINAIEPRHQPYLLETRFAPTASKEAATATAAHDVLSSIVSSVPQRVSFPNRASLLETLDTEYTASLAALPDGLSRAEGIAAGEAAADAMI